MSEIGDYIRQYAKESPIPLTADKIANQLEFKEYLESRSYYPGKFEDDKKKSCYSE